MRLYGPFEGVRNRTASNIVKKEKKEKCRKKNMFPWSVIMRNIPVVCYNSSTTLLGFTGYVAECRVLHATNNDGDCVPVIGAMLGELVGATVITLLYKR